MYFEIMYKEKSYKKVGDASQLQGTGLLFLEAKIKEHKQPTEAEKFKRVMFIWKKYIIIKWSVTVWRSHLKDRNQGRPKCINYSHMF